MAIFPPRNPSKLGKAQQVYPYLLPTLAISHRNQVWQVDITCIPMAKGFMYLVAILDVHSRFVVGWHISNHMNAHWVVATLEEALARHGKPLIVTSHPGSQFTCKKWVECLLGHHLQISREGKGGLQTRASTGMRAIDKVYMERLWRTVTYAYVYLSPPENGWELYQGLKAFFERYNCHKYHPGINRQLPVSV